nr:Molybdenum cofactor synthesis protein 3 [Polyrhizophydium stewartii]
MLLLDAELGSFRTVRLRAKNADCAVCGINPSITAPIDYVQFCGASAHDKTPDLSLLEPHERISVEQLRQARDARTPHVLLDVRDKIQVDICALDGSLHIPLNKLDDEIGAITDRIRAAAPPGAPPESVPVYAICRRGNDSQLAVQKLKVRGIANALDVIGGLREWSRSIDPTFPSH